MRKLGTWALALALIGAPAIAQPAPGGPRGFRPDANPSAIVAAEIAFNRLAQEKGQWTAFRETAAEDAVMFVPQAVNARGWLKGRADPPASVVWQPGAVWISCDGSLALSKGSWRRADGSTGVFTTIWRRDKRGDYEWVLDQGDTQAGANPSSDMIAGTIADCTGVRRPAPDGKRGDRKPALAPVGSTTPGSEGGGASADGTLTWSYTVAPDLGRTLRVELRQNGAMRPVFDMRVAPPAG